MTNFTIMVEQAKKQARQKNLMYARQQIKQRWMQEKIQNYLIRWNYPMSAQEIEEQILTNDIIASFFAKDPTKQNISEKLIAKYLGWELLKQTGPNAIRFNTQGDIVSTKTLGGGKCADFYVYNRYITQKYTGENTGGAQDNQMDDVITFLTNASIKYKCGACVDGWYWDEGGHKAQLIEMFKSNPNVIIFSADEIKQGVINLA